MMVRAMSDEASNESRLCICTKIHANNKPIPVPPITIHRKFNAACCQMNCPVPTATNANRKMMSDEASLRRLSPSSMVDVDRGILTNLVMAPVLTASGGATIPPNRNPNAIVNPGMKWLATTATDIAVKNTTRNAKLPMMRHHFRISLNEIAQLASNRSGGRKIKKIRSGLMRTTGKPGMKLMRSPATTSKIG